MFPKTAVKLRRLRELYDQRSLGVQGEDGRDRARPLHPRRARLPDRAWEEPVALPIAPVAPVFEFEIPDGWKHWTWPQVMSLGAKCSRVALKGKLEVYGAVEAEIKRRARVVLAYDASMINYNEAVARIQKAA